MSVALCGEGQSSPTDAVIAEGGGGILLAVVRFIKRHLGGRVPQPLSTKAPLESTVLVGVEPQLAVSCAPPVAVHVSQEVEEQHRMQATFEYSKSALSSIVLLAPLSEKLLSDIPTAKCEMDDVLVMALMVFLQIMKIVNGRESLLWDNSDVKSRIALAMSVSMAIKFVMDTRPLGPTYALSCVLKPEEINCSQEQLLDYFQQYECVVLNNVSLYRCYFNHKVWAHQALWGILGEARVGSPVGSLVEELLLFFSFHVSERLPLYVSIGGEGYIGPALVLLSLECIISVSGFAAVETEPRGDAESYKLAAKMASDVSAEDTTHMQAMLQMPFTDQFSWQRRATTQSNIKKAGIGLDRRGASVARPTPDRQKQCSVV